MTRLEVKDLSVRRGSVDAIKSLSFELAAGTNLALVGPNGAGKTSLILAALGLVDSTGTLRIDGQDPRTLAPKERVALCSYLPQGETSSEDLRVIDAVMAGRIRFNEPRRLSRQKAESYLAELRLEDLALRPLNALSGGQRQQVSLAALLAQEAKFAWLDEPANHLDPARRLEALEHIRERSHAHGMGVVVVTHDVSLLTAMGEELQVLGLKKGRQAFRCTVNDADLSEQLSELYERPVRAVEVEGQRVITVLSGAR